MEDTEKVGTKDLANRLSEQYPQLSTEQCEKAIKKVCKRIALGVAEDERTEIRGFGSFKAVIRNPGTKRNPRTGDKVNVGHRGSVHFKPGKELKERVNNKIRRNIEKDDSSKQT